MRFERRLAAGALVLLLLFLNTGSGATRQQTGLDRPFDPVVLAGSQFPNFLGVPIDELFVYAFSAGIPSQIAFQVDEQDSSGMFVPAGDGLLGASEEIVFLAASAGDSVVDPGISLPGGLVYPDYIVKVTDPLTAGNAYAYLYHSQDLQPAALNDLISYDPVLDRISSADTYTTGFSPSNGLRETLTLGAGTADLLDRDKIRVDGYVFFPSLPFSITEDDVQQISAHALDGLVRVTRVATSTIDVGGSLVTGTATTFFYPGVFVQPVSFTTPGDPVNTTYFRFSTDLSPAAAGGVYTDEHNAGVLVDGSPDAITTLPATNWRSFSFPEGLFTMVAPVPPGVSNAETYYKDNALPDPIDTGDQLSYGDAGVEIDDPAENQTYAFSLSVYFEAAGGSGSGAQHYQYALNPVAVTVTPFVQDLPFDLFLPLVSRGN